MLRPSAAWWLFLFIVLLLSCAPGPTRAQTPVDLALVLAVDASFSMDPDEQQLQRQGYVDAFRSPTIHHAIHDGVLGRIAVMYLDWTRATDQRIVVPWTLVEQPEDAVLFAERLALTSTRRDLGGTSLSGAIDFGHHLLLSAPYRADRGVIDLSGDGANNHGRPVTHARDDAVAAGITINGLALMLKRPQRADEIENVDDYYRDCVIGGPGAFMMAVRDRRTFADAIKLKLVREIANLAADPLVQKAHADALVNCLSGEQLADRQAGRCNFGLVCRAVLDQGL